MTPVLGQFGTIVLLIFGGGDLSRQGPWLSRPRSEPSSGLLITFWQFLFTTLASAPTQLSAKGPYGLRPSRVPISRWAVIAAMFFTINMLNNWAFAFDVSVPVHIILRSFGSVTTMLAGFVRGKRYSFLQVFSVVLLTAGVLVSAWADSESKGKSMSLETAASASRFATGLGILLLAQLLSAYQGAFVEDTYSMYQADWTENLFYSHIFSLPMFLPLSLSLQQQYASLAATGPLDLDKAARLSREDGLWSRAPPDAVLGTSLRSLIESLPRGVLFLLVNAVTQLACISGVNLLAAKSSAVTVTIVLNVRKLVSFIFSTILFGHHLSAKMILGSALVFGSGALYGWESTWRLPRERRRKAVQGGGPGNGTVKRG
ncbi:UDP-N-acetylglucosamine transporter yea4-like [Teratosphaeria destructans]|uniref:UDP-N-acetylglucosamine transporter yea4-like n=1 Tax=Teratosphaeria destructans TaxID=418781 RepID=A0A9W7SQC1_9PEZI|nr:UDP-N-acetylglucosamine transporter yea4-like [Teratosphaeria destructans]